MIPTLATSENLGKKTLVLIRLPRILNDPFLCVSYLLNSLIWLLKFLNDGRFGKHHKIGDPEKNCPFILSIIRANAFSSKSYNSEQSIAIHNPFHIYQQIYVSTWSWCKALGERK
jgi:hypothetical protein